MKLQATTKIKTAAGLITPDEVRMVIDRSKIKRAQMKLLSWLKSKFDEETRENGITCLFFDERKDHIKIFIEVGN